MALSYSVKDISKSIFDFSNKSSAKECVVSYAIIFYIISVYHVGFCTGYFNDDEMLCMPFKGWFQVH